MELNEVATVGGKTRYLICPLPTRKQVESFLPITWAIKKCDFESLQLRMPDNIVSKAISQHQGEQLWAGVVHVMQLVPRIGDA